MRDYATKSYRTEQSTGLVWLVTILTSIFLIAGYQAFHRLDHAPVKYKWMDKCTMTPPVLAFRARTSPRTS